MQQRIFGTAFQAGFRYVSLRPRLRHGLPSLRFVLPSRQSNDEFTVPHRYLSCSYSLSHNARKGWLYCKIIYVYIEHADKFLDLDFKRKTFVRSLKQHFFYTRTTKILKKKKIVLPLLNKCLYLQVILN